MNDELVHELVHEQLTIIKAVQKELKSALMEGRPSDTRLNLVMMSELTQQLAHLNGTPAAAPKKAGRPKKEPVIQVPQPVIQTPPPPLPTPTTYSWGNDDGSRYQ